MLLGLESRAGLQEQPLTRYPGLDLERSFATEDSPECPRPLENASALAADLRAELERVREALEARSP